MIWSSLVWNALAIIYYHWFVYLLVFFFFLLFFSWREGEVGRWFSLGPSLSLCLERPKVGLEWVSLCIYVCFLCNSCYIYVVYLLSRKKNLRQKKGLYYCYFLAFCSIFHKGTNNHQRFGTKLPFGIMFKSQLQWSSDVYYSIINFRLDQK